MTSSNFLGFVCCGALSWASKLADSLSVTLTSVQKLLRDPAGHMCQSLGLELRVSPDTSYTINQLSTSGEEEGRDSVAHIHNPSKREDGSSVLTRICMSEGKHHLVDHEQEEGFGQGQHFQQALGVGIADSEHQPP